MHSAKATNFGAFSVSARLEGLAITSFSFFVLALPQENVVNKLTL